MTEQEHPPLDEAHRKLLKYLATDDGFRRAFSENPGETLVKYRLITHVPEGFPTQVKVPSKEDAVAILEEGVSRETFVPFMSTGCPLV